ncbi:hypothetical protein [Mucilaginibacter agri]|uniref:LTXXQ motif family protein n=1 Tax=Mucilaginibacter agri TaxID=2695265 RepID=A0A966DS32_9SPHI|nr:hypothetical protein [Mucilaginibacter agri]NCD69713.1 hypothetical protein [Mucilaginibacter agri]
MKRLMLICCFAALLVTAANAQTKHAVSPDPLNKAKDLQKELKLTDSQTLKIASIYDDSSKQFEKIKVAENGNTNKMMADIKPLRVSTINKIKAVLTPSQATKYDTMVKTSKDSNGGNGWSDGWSSTESAN